MMKQSLLTILLLVPGAVASAQSLEALYPTTASKIHRLVPYRLKVPGLTEGQVQSVSLDGAQALDCGVMRDPYRFDLFLLKCSKPVDQVSIKISILQNSTMTNLTFGPLVIVDASGVAPVTPEPDPGPLPIVLDGAKLTADNCLACHGSVATLKAKKMDLLKLKNAITSQPLMGSLTTLTGPELEAIVNYVNK